MTCSTGTRSVDKVVRTSRPRQKSVFLSVALARVTTPKKYAENVTGKKNEKKMSDRLSQTEGRRSATALDISSGFVVGGRYRRGCGWSRPEPGFLAPLCLPISSPSQKKNHDLQQYRGSRAAAAIFLASAAARKRRKNNKPREREAKRIGKNTKLGGTKRKNRLKRTERETRERRERDEREPRENREREDEQQERNQPTRTSKYSRFLLKSLGSCSASDGMFGKMFVVKSCFMASDNVNGASAPEPPPVHTRSFTQLKA